MRKRSNLVKACNQGVRRNSPKKVLHRNNLQKLIQEIMLMLRGKFEKLKEEVNADPGYLCWRSGRDT
ncbi:hypothetical protein L2E82_22622 [Cichorium intybus]|uniref:Uncharacterized protein n=1 Tax=Cichorium intybus TaxID=13427 RepID=A0ACB9DY22_CICIN|nr:hypothetical protein L2E82_22622 [Cichorium intybus]